jgi:hypothetical protein
MTNNDYKVCPICNGFGRVYPLKPDGKPDCTTAVYCKCQGSNEGKVAWKPLFTGS